jgi:hypothetical protein
MLSWALIWNALLGLGLFLDRGADRAHSIHFAQMFAIAAFGTALLCFSIVYVPRIQAIALRPGATMGAVRRDLLFVGALTAVMGSISFVGGFLQA